MGAFTGSPVKLTYDDYLLLSIRYQAGPIDVIVDLRRVW